MDFTDLILFLERNKDLLTVLLAIAGVILTIIGWIAVFLLGLWQQKKQLKNTASMKVYEELYLLKKKLDERSSALGLQLGKYSLPFLTMSFEKNPSNLVEENSKALQYWFDYTHKMSENVFEFTGAYLELWNHSDMWISVIPQVQKAKKELFEVQLKELTNKLHEHQRYLQDQSVKQWNWKLWNKEEIEQKSEEMVNLFNAVAIGYVDDYLGLIHNRLVSPIFKHKKKPRENFANMDKLEKYYILTEEGLKEMKGKKD